MSTDEREVWVAVRRELLHSHVCGPGRDDAHEYECIVMICRDKPVKTCWEHRMREPSERPRVS